MHVRIAGFGKCLPGIDVPGRIVDNKEMVELLLAGGAIKPGTGRPWTREELRPEGIETLVGIKQRHWVADEVNTSDLGLFAAEKAMAQAGIGWEDVGILVVGSSTPEAHYPSTACWILNKVQKKKIADGTWTEEEAKTKFRIPAFDIMAACASSLFAIDLVRKMLLSEENGARWAVIVGAEVMSRMMNFEDTNSDLFGDGAGAVVLERTEGPGKVLWTETGTDTWAADLTYSYGHDTRFHATPEKPDIFLLGHEVQRYALKVIPELAAKTLQDANRGLGLNLTADDISLFVCHQANSRIFDFPAKKLGVPVDRFYINVDRRANCSSASVLMALAEAYEEGRIKKGDRIMLVSFGGGMTWASTLIEW